MFFVGGLGLRLLGDPTKTAVIEVYDGFSEWGRVCPIGWSINQARIFCHHFGYSSAVAATRVSSEDFDNIVRRNVIQFDENCWRPTLEDMQIECKRKAISKECDCSAMHAGIICSSTGNF